MKEEFLHYLWQYQLFNKKELTSTKGISILVQKTGNHNTNSGPDFSNAKLTIGKQVWAGNIEIHLKSSDWYVHNHEKDPAYDNVILHVVWKDDMAIFRSNNTPICTLELKGLVPKELLHNYQQLFQNNTKWIACENNLENIAQFHIDNWLERLYIERLEQKSIYITDLLSKETNHWEAVLFKLLAKNYGLKINATSFAAMADSVNFNIIRKEKNKQENLEALLMGQSGLLSKDYDDVYYNNLKQLYRYQKEKYKLETSKINVAFFRLRPPNFPTIRISQLANLYVNRVNLFQDLMQENKLENLYRVLNSQTSGYWDTHYSFDKESRKRIKKTTKSFLDLLIINTIIPLKFSYQKHLGSLNFEPLLKLIREVKPEKNSIINKFKQLGIDSQDALQSQALLELKNNYCDKQKCLQCQIGASLLRQ